MRADAIKPNPQRGGACVRAFGYFAPGNRPAEDRFDFRLVMLMKYFPVFPLLLLVASCSLQPARVATAPAAMSKAVCDAMAGADWMPADKPGISDELLAMASFPRPPESVLWYSSRPGSYIACAHVKSAGTCSYTTHAFNQLPEHGGKNWSYLSGSVKRQGCAQTSPQGA